MQSHFLDPWDRARHFTRLIFFSGLSLAIVDFAEFQRLVIIQFSVRPVKWRSSVDLGLILPVIPDGAPSVEGRHVDEEELLVPQGDEKLDVQTLISLVQEYDEVSRQPDSRV